MELQIARGLAAHRPAGVLEALESSVAERRTAFATGDTPRVPRQPDRLSDILAEACGNNRMLKLLVHLRSVLLVIGKTSLRAPGREERSIAEHEAIVAAIRNGDEEEAATATARHIHSIEHARSSRPDAIRERNADPGRSPARRSPPAASRGTRGRPVGPR